MKVFALVFFTAFVGALAAPSENNELTTSEEQFVENFVKNYGEEIERYVKNAMRELAESICTDKSTDLATPLEEVVKRASEIDDDSETVCTTIQNHLEYVLDPLTKAIDGCLPNEEAGVAGYVVKAIVSIVSKVCESTGEELLELANPCLDEIDLEGSQCIQNVEDKWNEVTKTGTKSFKELVCSEYADIRPCLETAIADKCKLEITKRSILGIIDSVGQTPCSA